MGYFEELQNSANYLCEIQRPDKGWGLTKGMDSSIVNTAEAVYVLDNAHKYDYRDGGINFIVDTVFDHISTRGERIRYVAVPLYIFSLIKQFNRTEFINKCIDWLKSARNTDNGWGFDGNDDSSKLFPTFQSMMALKAWDDDEKFLKECCQWVMSQSTNKAWSLEEDDKISPVATAYALRALHDTPSQNNPIIEEAKNYLLQTSHWGSVDNSISGTVWKHCTYFQVVSALIEYGEDPYEHVISQAVRYINKLRSNRGGWDEAEVGGNRSVRSQYCAVTTIKKIHDSFDPAIHTLRIDAERTEDTLTEPDFVKFKLDTKWASIIPARLYVLLANLCIGISLLLITDIHRYISDIPQRWDSVLAIIFLAISWQMVRIRKKYMKKLWNFGKLIVGLLAILDLIFGKSIVENIDALSNFVTYIIKYFTS